MVTNYDYVLDILKLDKAKGYKTIENHLFNGNYIQQVDGLKQGLIDAGIKYLNGKAIGKKDLNTLVSKIESQREGWLKGYTKFGTKEDKLKELLEELGII